MNAMDPSARYQVRDEKRIAGGGVLQALAIAHKAHFFEPLIEFRRGAQAERLAEIMAVVKAGGLVIEHDVIGAGDAHDEVASGHAEECEKRIHIVLVGLRVIRVADVAAHREAEQFPAEVILEPGADDLFAVVKILRADEADDGIDQERLELARNGVGAGLRGLLIDAMMRARGEA